MTIFSILMVFSALFPLVYITSVAVSDDSIFDKTKKEKFKSKWIDKYIEKHCQNIILCAKYFPSIIKRVNKEHNGIMYSVPIDFKIDSLRMYGNKLFHGNYCELSKILYNIMIDDMDNIIKDLLKLRKHDKYTFNKDVYLNKLCPTTIKEYDSLRKIIDSTYEYNHNKSFIFDVVNKLLYWNTTNLGHHEYENIYKEYSQILDYIFNKYCSSITITDINYEILNKIKFKKII